MIAPVRIGRDENYKSVMVKPEHRYRHVMVIGSTGSGKTNSLKWFWYQDCLIGVAKILIDPSGSFAEEAYVCAKNALYCSLDNPIGINPLALPYHPDDIADIVIEAINQVITVLTQNVLLTVRMRHILRDAIVWCINNNRRRLDLVIDRLSVMKEHHETRQSVIDRLQMFVQDTRLKEILCEAPPIDIETIVSRGMTFVLDCHGMNEDKMIFVGTLLTQMVKNYFRYSRKDKYDPLILYIDECHNFLNQNTFNLLREGRKHSISAVMATTDFAGFSDRLVHTILSNVGTIVAFRTGFREAVQIAKEFATLKLEDVQFLEKHWAAVKTPETEAIVKTQLAPPVKKKPIVNTGKPSANRLTKVKWFSTQKSCPSSDDSEHQGGSSLTLKSKEQKSRCTNGTANESDGNFRVEKTSNDCKSEVNVVT